MSTVEDPAGRDDVNQEPDLRALKFLFIDTNSNNTSEPVHSLSHSKPDSSSSSPTSSGMKMPHDLPAYLSAALSASVEAKPRMTPVGPVTLQQMRGELCQLRNELDTLKTQHNKEITLLMNELDEEKKMRLSLQIDVERLQKHILKKT